MIYQLNFFDLELKHVVFLSKIQVQNNQFLLKFYKNIDIYLIVIQVSVIVRITLFFLF